MAKNIIDRLINRHTNSVARDQITIVMQKRCIVV